LRTVSAELRERLELLSTGELVAILETLDLERWRPEVFPVVEGILRDRGLDVAGISGRRRAAPAPPAPDRELQEPRTWKRWESTALAFLIAFESSFVGLPILGFVALYIASAVPVLTALPIGLSVWWLVVLGILSHLKKITRLPYVTPLFAAAMAAGQTSVFALHRLILRPEAGFDRYDVLLPFATGVAIAFAFVSRAGRGQPQGRRSNDGVDLSLRSR
jgi:hypothetical protein